MYATQGADPMRNSNHGSRFEETSRSINGAMSLPKHALKADASPRMNLAKQAQVDFMNSRYLGQTAGPFVEKQPSVFMTESSMMQPSNASPRLRIQVQPSDVSPGGEGRRRVPAFNLALQTTQNSGHLGRLNNSMFATNSKQVFQ